MSLKNLSLFTFLLLFVHLSQGHAAKDADGFYEMRRGGKKIISTLNDLPYTKEGKGPIVYILSYSDGNANKTMYRDFLDKKLDVEIRRILMPIGGRTSRDAVALAKSRDINDYHAFMQGRKNAPDFSDDTAGVNLHNNIVKGTNAVLSIMKKNGWPHNGFAFPQYIWAENGKVFASEGYSKAHFNRAVARMQQAAVPKNVGDKPSQLRKSAKGDFTIQGITTGMSQDEIKTTLTTNGWEFSRGWRKTKDNKMKIILLKYHNIEGKGIAGRIEYKLSFLSENFNAAEITKTLQNKYPAREKGGGYGNRAVYLKEYPKGPTNEEMTTACKGDAMERGMPAYQALGKAQKVANLANWSKTGNADFNQTCPAVATLWKKYLNAYLGKTLDITVAPGHNERWVKMVVDEQRIYQTGLRYLFEKNQKQKQAQPKATIDSSDF